jgi:hypothetical protein
VRRPRGKSSENYYSYFSIKALPVTARGKRISAKSGVISQRKQKPAEAGFNDCKNRLL